MGALTRKVPPMNAATFPTGAALERETDERIRKTIVERIAIANDPKTIFVPHHDVFSASKKRLLAVKPTGR
jgi:hypothetical protein